jgi:glycosyltransferase involved in cell wall biosynthesis
MMASNTPLVSVVVITYNSMKYVLETLQSIKNQTYGNIELIVSDDCSTDQTLEIIEGFVLENGNFFERVEIVKSSRNSGITPNCNRGILASSGVYIKPIAGDDLLMPNCIRDFVSFFQAHGKIEIAASCTKVFYEDDLNNFHIWPKRYEFPIGLEKQKLEILRANFVYNVSIFFTRNLFNSVGGFEEKYSMIEDYPFDYKVLSKGYEIYLLDKITVNYRVNFDSTTRPLNQNKFVNVVSHNQGAEFIRENILPVLLSKRMYMFYLLRCSKLKLIDAIIANGNNIGSINNKYNRKFLHLNKLLSGKLRRFYNRLS